MHQALHSLVLCLSLPLSTLIVGCAEPPPASDVSPLPSLPGAVRPDVWPVSLEGWMLDSASLVANSTEDDLDVAELHALARSLDGSGLQELSHVSLLFLVSDGTLFPVAVDDVDGLIAQLGHPLRVIGAVDRWGKLTITGSQPIGPAQ